jgi:alcohol dehydrogenase class IV
MPNFTFNTTPSIRHTAGGAAHLGTLLKGLPFAATATKVLFVTDPGIVKLGLCDAALQSIRGSGFDLTVFDAVEGPCCIDQGQL